MGLRTITSVYSPKMIRTILTGRNKALSPDTQNTLQTLGLLQTEPGPKKVKPSLDFCCGREPGPQLGGKLDSYIQDLPNLKSPSHLCLSLRGTQQYLG